MKKLMLISFLFYAVMLFSSNVSGHLTQDTHWTLAGSPYVVTGFLYINSGVTLTIDPGVTVKIYSASLDSLSNFWDTQQEPRAKSIIVSGKIVALGTQEQPIIFDRNNNNQNHRWGLIRFMESAPASIFEYCHFNYAYATKYNWEGLFRGTLCLDNGRLKIRNCNFLDNHLWALLGFVWTQ